MKIRDYKPGDYSQIMALWLKTDLGNPARGDDKEVIERSIQMGGKFLVMEQEDQKIIGTSWITYDGRRLYLHHFGIDPDHQGKGLSKRLLEESLNFARHTGIQIKLEVHKENLKALELYKKNGFSYLGDYAVLIIRTYI